MGTLLSKTTPILDNFYRKFCHFAHPDLGLRLGLPSLPAWNGNDFMI